MKYRKQTQHIRRYRSGRWICVNKGIKYLKRKKTFGSALFRDQIRNQLFGDWNRALMLQDLKHSQDPILQRIITDPEYGVEKIVQFLEKNPDIFSDIKGAKIVFVRDHPKLGEFIHDAKYGDIILIDERFLREPAIELPDQLEKGTREIGLQQIFRHEAVHRKFNYLPPMHRRWDEIASRYAEDRDPKKIKLSEHLVGKSFKEVMGDAD